MEHVGHVWRVRSGMAQEYWRRHRTIWPELEALLRGAGVETYAIYQWGDVVFSHLAIEDYDRLVAAYENDPVAERWEASLADVLEFPNADPATGWPERLEEVGR
jgi:L-rhamnose mutarotase